MRVYALLPLLLLAACVPTSVDLRLHPVVGSTPSPAPIPCKFRAQAGWRNATLVAILPEGETVSGTVSLVGKSSPPDHQLAGVWDQVYGTGYYNANVLGAHNHSRVVLKNEKGIEITVELFGGPEKTDDSQGVAIAKNGQIYKLGY